MLDEFLSDEPVQKSPGSPMPAGVQESQPSQETSTVVGPALQMVETDPQDEPGCSWSRHEAELSIEESSTPPLQVN